MGPWRGARFLTLPFGLRLVFPEPVASASALVRRLAASALGKLAGVVEGPAVVD